MRSHVMARLMLGLVAFVGLAAVACNTTTSAPVFFGPQHLYVTDEGSPSKIFVYTLPVSATSTPAVTVLTTGNLAQNPCFDGAGHIYVPLGVAADLPVFNLPLTTGSIQAFTLPVTNAEDCHFDAAGNMYVAFGVASIGVFQAPVQSSSTGGTPITDQVSGPFGVWTDAAGDVFVADETYVTEYSSLGSANALLAKFGTIQGGSNFGAAIGPTGSLYVPNGTARNQIDVYDPPFTNSSAKNASKTITVQALTSSNYLTWVSFDRAGDLYVGASDNTLTANHVFVFPPPYTTVGVDLNTGTLKVRGVAIGP
ncbi:MAG TPA: hypothetical protein VN934_12665 [Candidatus Tumulicola sp.]|nr:hypothetical protein [Candidatus Tumulicola sp.]